MCAKAGRGKVIKAPSDVYTTLMALVLGVVCATAALVALQSYLEYGTLFRIIEVMR